MLLFCSSYEVSSTNVKTNDPEHQVNRSCSAIFETLLSARQLKQMVCVCILVLLIRFLMRQLLLWGSELP